MTNIFVSPTVEAKINGKWSYFSQQSLAKGQSRIDAMSDQQYLEACKLLESAKGLQLRIRKQEF